MRVARAHELQQAGAQGGAGVQGPVQRGRGGVSQEAVPAAGEWVGLFSVFEPAYFKACEMDFVVWVI